MTPNHLKEIISYLQNRVSIDKSATGEIVSISFIPPTEGEMLSAGLEKDGVSQISNSNWWSDMCTDIIETPEFCEPDDTLDQILQYAKDVVSEYIMKRVNI